MNEQARQYSYSVHFPASQALQFHLQQNPKAFNIQIIGARGTGKSTLINYFIRERFGIHTVSLAKTSVVECTKETTFYNVSSAFRKELERSDTFNKVFLADQPGIGGTEIKRNDFSL